MASISTSAKTQTRRVVWTVGPKQFVVRLGKVDNKTATAVKLHVERLIISTANHAPPPADTAMWLSRVSDTLHERIARTGICEPRLPLDLATLGPVIDAFVDSRKAYVKSGTVATWMQCRRHLCKAFGEKRKLATITPADAEDFRRRLRGECSEAYTAKMIMIAKSFLRHAVQRKLIDVSPFAGVKNGSQRNPERRVFVDRPTIQKVIDAAPDARWRLIIALARFGGLRVPSEISALTWQDINWAEGRMTVRSPKTQHHTGHASRVTPIFPELLPYLREAFEAAEEGEVHVVSGLRWTSGNLRSRLLLIITRAAVKPWPKVFQNLRSSRATELADKFPSHVAAAWLGHAEKVADDHYRQVTEEHFAKAAGNDATIKTEKASRKATQHTAETTGIGRNSSGGFLVKNANFPRISGECRMVPISTMGDKGSELKSCSVARHMDVYSDIVQTITVWQLSA